MFRDILIRDIYGKTVPDSNGNPVIEVEVMAGDCAIGRASVENKTPPESFGELEELADCINARIAPELIGVNILELGQLERLLELVVKKLERTEEEKERLVLGISVAAVRAAAKVLESIS